MKLTVKILTDLYQRQMKSLDEAWNNRAADLPYKDKYEALIMASIIEKETSVDSELEQVSGVFVRRLKLGMRLQTDPTVIYGMGDRLSGQYHPSRFTYTNAVQYLYHEWLTANADCIAKSKSH